MRNRMKNVGILTAFCVVALFCSRADRVHPRRREREQRGAAAEVHDNGGFTTATVVGVQDQTTPITDATVTVNGNVVNLFFLAYYGTFTPAFTVGGPVALHFASKDLDVTSTLTMPDKPTITTTAPGPLVGIQLSSAHLDSRRVLEPGRTSWSAFRVSTQSARTDLPPRFPPVPPATLSLPTRSKPIKGSYP